MDNILSTIDAIEKSKQIRAKGGKIVLAGGCFDILHVGHVKFLENARKEGDALFLLLESDGKVSKLKGRGRPINSQVDRAQVLSALKFVDYVILLKDMKSDENYDKLVNQIKPNVIATTKNDTGIGHKKRQAKMIKGETKEVIKRIEGKSTTNLNALLRSKNK